jgi:uncharacterized protein
MFEFDPEKSAANLAKHGIDFELAQALWRDERFVEGPVDWPGEERWMRVAGLDGKIWSAIFTVRNGRIRLISVRRSRPKEELKYGRQNQHG